MSKLCIRLLHKIAFIVILITMTIPANAAINQDAKINLQLQNASIKQVFSAIKKQANVSFMYSNDDVANLPRKNYNLSNATIKQVLDICLKGTNLMYEYTENTIIIRKKTSNKNVPSGSIQGIVRDPEGRPLPGATILLVGSVRGTSTDANGHFSLSLNGHENLAITVSFLGMKKQTISVHGGSYYNILMEADEHTTQEVVITGYGNIRKSSFTGSSTTVKRDELMKVSPTNVISALQTFDPSFRIQTNDQWGSDPNSLPEMYIRGRSGIGIKELDKDPLTKSNLQNNPNLPTFIMDGFQVSVEKVYDLDPSRIESITILKDAAATAMYGSRAANGVVVITTVAPQPGEVRVSYNFTGTLSMPDLSDYRLANAAEKLEIERLSGLFEPGNTVGNSVPSHADGMNKYYEKYAQIVKGVDTDWLSLPLRNAFNHKHSLYIEGGNQDLRYGIDASYNNDNGVMKDSYRNRYSFGFSIDYRLSNLQVKNYVSYGHMKSQESPYGAFSDYSKLQPYDTPYEDNGTLKKTLPFSTSGTRTANNPLYEATLHNYDWDSYDEFLDNLSFNWYINSYWTIKGQFSITKQFIKGEKFIDPLSNKVSVLGSSEDEHLAGDLYTDKGDDLRWNTNAFLYYTRTLKKHNLNFSLGVEASSTNTSSTSAHYRGFPSGEFHSLNYAAEIYKKPTKSENTTRLFSTIGSLNYTYDNIYLLDAAVRFDGSSEFGSNQKWAPFFSGGIGLNIHNYEFLKGNRYINQLKIRGSYGRTGKVNFAPYAATTMYEAMFDEWYVTGYGVTLKALGNRNLSWEKTDKFDVGFDFQFFNQRLTITGDYFYEKTIDLINDVTLSTTSGFSTYKNNLGEVENKGVEFQIRGDIVQTKNWNLALWGNLSHNKNKILKISDSQKAYNERVQKYYAEAEQYQNTVNASSDSKYAIPIPQYAEGGSITSIWGVQSLGIDPTTGKELFLNRDGSVSSTWQASQQVVLGNTEPKVQGSFGFNLGYRNSTLFASFLYECGGQAYNQTLVDNVENADIAYSNVDLRVLTDRWQKPGDITQLKDIKDRNATTLPSSRFVQTNNLLNMSALTLSYDFERKWIQKMHMNMLRIEISTNDLFYISTVKRERGLDYPKAWDINFAVKVQF